MPSLTILQKIQYGFCSTALSETRNLSVMFRKYWFMIIALAYVSGFLKDSES